MQFFISVPVTHSTLLRVFIVELEIASELQFCIYKTLGHMISNYIFSNSNNKSPMYSPSTWFCLKSVVFLLLIVSLMNTYPASTVLAGRFITTAPLGKHLRLSSPCINSMFYELIQWCCNNSPLFLAF